MVIQSIDLENFRNYEQLHLELGEGIHIFYGDNAQGKTNILESVYMAATNKSHRGSKDKEMIRFGCEEGHIKVISEKKRCGLSHRHALEKRKKQRNRSQWGSGSQNKRFSGNCELCAFFSGGLADCKRGTAGKTQIH